MIPRGRVALLGALALLATLACGGPRPVIVSQELRPPEAPGQPYLLIVNVRNDSGGEGQVTLEAMIYDVNGQIAANEENHVASLEPHGNERLTIPVQPAAPGPYTVKVVVSYPP